MVGNYTDKIPKRKVLDGNTCIKQVSYHHNLLSLSTKDRSEFWLIPYTCENRLAKASKKSSYSKHIVKNSLPCESIERKLFVVFFSIPCTQGRLQNNFRQQ